MSETLFDEEPVQLEQVVFDYRLLSADKREFVLQKTDETQILLKRTAENIIQIGKNLQDVNSVMPHGMFLRWLKSEFGMSRQTADNFRHVADKFKDKMLNFSNLSISALYALAEPNTPPEAIEMAIERSQSEKITHALAKQIIETQEALKKAQEDEAQTHAELIVQQQLLLKSQQEAATTIEALEQQIATLETPHTEYIDKIVWPEEKAKELQELQTKLAQLHVALESEKRAVPTEAQKKIETLQAQLEKLKEERRQQKEYSEAQEQRIKKLNEDIHTAIRNRELVDNSVRIRQEWRLAASAVHAALMRLLGSLPTPVDVQSFEADDWGHVDRLKVAFRRALEELEQLRYSETIVDPALTFLSIVEAG